MDRRLHLVGAALLLALAVIAGLVMNGPEFTEMYQTEGAVVAHTAASIAGTDSASRPRVLAIQCAVRLWLANRVAPEPRSVPQQTAFGNIESILSKCFDSEGNSADDRMYTWLETTTDADSWIRIRQGLDRVKAALEGATLSAADCTDDDFVRYLTAVILLDSYPSLGTIVPDGRRESLARVEDMFLRDYLPPVTRAVLHQMFHGPSAVAADSFGRDDDGDLIVPNPPLPHPELGGPCAFPIPQEGEGKEHSLEYLPDAGYRHWRRDRLTSSWQSFVAAVGSATSAQSGDPRSFEPPDLSARRYLQDEILRGVEEQELRFSSEWYEERGHFLGEAEAYFGRYTATIAACDISAGPDLVEATFQALPGPEPSEARVRETFFAHLRASMGQLNVPPQQPQHTENLPAAVMFLADDKISWVVAPDGQGLRIFTAPADVWGATAASVAELIARWEEAFQRAVFQAHAEAANQPSAVLVRLAFGNTSTQDDETLLRDLRRLWLRLNRIGTRDLVPSRYNPMPGRIYYDPPAAGAAWQQLTSAVSQSETASVSTRAIVFGLPLYPTPLDERSQRAFAAFESSRAMARIISQAEKPNEEHAHGSDMRIPEERRSASALEWAGRFVAAMTALSATDPPATPVRGRPEPTCSPAGLAGCLVAVFRASVLPGHDAALLGGCSSLDPVHSFFGAAFQPPNRARWTLRDGFPEFQVRRPNNDLANYLPLLIRPGLAEIPAPGSAAYRRYEILQPVFEWLSADATRFLSGVLIETEVPEVGVRHYVAWRVDAFASMSTGYQPQTWLLEEAPIDEPTFSALFAVAERNSAQRAGQ